MAKAQMAALDAANINAADADVSSATLSEVAQRLGVGSPDCNVVAFGAAVLELAALVHAIRADNASEGVGAAVLVGAQLGCLGQVPGEADEGGHDLSSRFDFGVMGFIGLLYLIGLVVSMVSADYPVQFPHIPSASACAARSAARCSAWPM